MLPCLSCHECGCVDDRQGPAFSPSGCALGSGIAGSCGDPILSWGSCRPVSQQLCRFTSHPRRRRAPVPPRPPRHLLFCEWTCGVSFVLQMTGDVLIISAVTGDLPASLLGICVSFSEECLRWSFAHFGGFTSPPPGMALRGPAPSPGSNGVVVPVPPQWSGNQENLTVFLPWFSWHTWLFGLDSVHFPWANGDVFQRSLMGVLRASLPATMAPSLSVFAEPHRWTRPCSSGFRHTALCGGCAALIPGLEQQCSGNETLQGLTQMPAGLRWVNTDTKQASHKTSDLGKALFVGSCTNQRTRWLPVLAPFTQT